MNRQHRMNALVQYTLAYSEAIFAKMSSEEHIQT